MTIYEEVVFLRIQNHRLRGKLKTYRRLLRLLIVIKGNINARLARAYSNGYFEINSYTD